MHTEDERTLNSILSNKSHFASLIRTAVPPEALHDSLQVGQTVFENDVLPAIRLYGATNLQRVEAVSCGEQLLQACKDSILAVVCDNPIGLRDKPPVLYRPSC